VNEDWLFRCSLKSQPVTWAVRAAGGGVFARVVRFQIRAWQSWKDGGANAELSSTPWLAEMMNP